MRFAIVLLLAACHTSTGTGACHGLDLETCRVTSDCVSDFCAGCGCDITYRGCLAAGETPAMCPQLGCPAGICCSADEPCQSSTGTCEQPGASQGCGVCNSTAGDCTSDAACTKPQVCDPIQCSCTGAMACVQGCVDDTTCDAGSTCNHTTARCVPRACSVTSPCGENFDCTGGECVRRTCTENLACDGYCVDGACFTQRGDCRLPVP
jgi:hypothetical protein